MKARPCDPAASTSPPSVGGRTCGAHERLSSAQLEGFDGVAPHRAKDANAAVGPAVGRLAAQPDTLQPMKVLDELGIRHTSDATPRVNETDITLSPDEFFRDATELLAAAGPVVRATVCPRLANTHGRWHPSGFMIYPLGTHPRLGTLRLHIWPPFPRRREERPVGLIRDIHDHVMHITSLVLAGVYTDTMFNVRIRTCGAETARMPNEHRVFEPPEGGAAAVALQATPRVALATVKQARIITEGSFHTIEAGAFHVPTIADSDLAATLVLSSPRVLPAGSYVLVGCDEDVLQGAALPVSPDDASRVVDAFGWHSSKP